MSSSAVDFAPQNHPRFLDELKDLLRIPSISTLPEHKDDCRQAAELLAAELKRIGMENVRLIETAGPSAGLCRLAACCGQAHRARLWPLRCAAPRSARRMALAALRAHRAQRQHLRARRRRRQRPGLGAGQGARIAARRATSRCRSMSACSLKAKKKWEGRELPSYVASKPANLKADFALVSDTELFAPGLPTLCVGLRGMIYTELEVRGAKTDLHSGMYGGAAPNPFVCAGADHRPPQRRKRPHPHPRLLRRHHSAQPGRTRRVEKPALRRRAVPHRRSRLAAAGRRGRLQRAGAHLGAAHARRARHPRRLHRRGRQDRHPRQGRRPKSPCAWFPA